MKKLIVLAVFLCFNLIESKACKRTSTTASGSKAPKRFCGGDLIFEDNFNSFDFSIWKHEKTLSGGGNWEFQWYDDNRANSFVKNGNLYISPTLTSDYLGSEAALSSATIKIPANQCTDSSSWGCERKGTPQNILNPIRSAAIQTTNSFRFKYGFVEIRAMIPEGDWLWPALWLMPSGSKYGAWPRSGEIDLMESRGNADLTVNGKNIGAHEVGQTIHFGPSPAVRTYIHKSKQNNQGFDKGYHKYQMKWTANKLTFLIDNQEVNTMHGDFWKAGGFPSRAPGVPNPWTSRMAPFDQEFYFIINLAVGGVNYFPDNARNGHGKKPWSNNSPRSTTDFWNGKKDWLPTWKLNDKAKKSSLKVDYVKVWALEE